MNDPNRLAQLFAAERAESPPTAEVARGWEDLKSALQAGAAGPAIAHGPLKLGVSAATKSFLGGGLLAFTVTTGGLGLHAAVTRPAATAPSIASAVRVTNPQQLQPPASPPTPAASELPPPGPPASSPREAPTLQHELRLIKAAKQELDAGRRHLASVWLDEHATRFPHGVLRREREELRERLAALPTENRQRLEPASK